MQNERGADLARVIFAVAVLLVGLEIITQVSLTEDNPITVSGWIRNVNVINSETIIAVEPEHVVTPRPFTIRGRHPELWKGEHVELQMRCPQNVFDDSTKTATCDLLSMKRLGPDKEDR